MTSRRKRWLMAGAAGALLAAALISLAARIPFSSDVLRDRVTATLADRLDSEVELGNLRLRIFPSLHVEGTDLVVRHRGRRDVPPLISVDRFTVAADLLGLWRRRVDRVQLDGLTIQIPPGDDEPHDDSPAGGEHVASGPQVVLSLLEAEGARLVILRRDAAKPARTWQLHKLQMRNLSANTAMPFEATLTNAVPPGRIDTGGSFGPWHRDDPGHTPLSGEFVFDDADLSVFKGISGMLAAHGDYGGTLERIEVRGETDVPDFTVSVSGHPVPLHAKYHAVVDGTNGNTTLERIEAQFLDTALVASGGVYEVENVKGRQVVLDVDMPEARLEDVMRLAVKTADAPMSGALMLKTSFTLPPGDVDVVDKLKLDGRFAIENGRFTDPGVQRKINELSQRARGRKGSPRDTGRQERAVSTSGSAPPTVGSDFTGRFRLGDGTLALPSLVFDVPGAVVDVGGRYRLRRETLAFNGRLVMDAKVSETMSGWKSLLLKAVDPLFRKNGKTVVPIKIEGTRSNPKFGINYGEVF